MSLIHHALIGRDVSRSARCALPQEYGDVTRKMPVEAYFEIYHDHLCSVFIDAAHIRTRLVPEYYREYYCQDTLSVERSLLFR